MQYLKYLKFFPLFMQLVEFIRDAEAKFTQPGTGADKAQWVVSNFLPVVQSAEDAGVIPGKLADALISGAPALVTLVVQLMKAVHGSVPAADNPPATDPYYTFVFASAQAAQDHGKSGDLVYKTADGTYRLVPGNVGGTPISVTHPDWTLVTTIQ